MTRPELARLGRVLALVALAALVGYLINQIDVDLEGQTWGQEPLLPYHIPVGVDFRNGLYSPAQALLRGGDPYTDVGSSYPPFATLLAMPFQLLDVDRAYLVQVGLLVVVNIATLWLALRLSKEVFYHSGSSDHIIDHALTFPLFLGVAFWLVTSYGFLFSLERGNFDIFPQFAALAGLWLLVKKPNWLWPQVICFSVAAHLKVYPAILLVLVLWKHRWKSLIPLLVVNTGLLLCLGLTNARLFLWVLRAVVQTPTPWLWDGNHSAESFAHMVNQSLSLKDLGEIPVLLFYLLPVGLFTLACLRLYRQGFSNKGVLWVFVLAAPVMCVIPKVSHDYKLVILAEPLAVLLFHLTWEYTTSGQRIRMLQIGSVLVLATLLGLSYARLPEWLGNKYPFIVALQVITLWVVAARPSGQPADASPSVPT